MDKISERTALPLSVVAVILVTVVGGVLWLSEIRALAIRNSERINVIEASIEATRNYRAEIWRSVTDQEKRLGRIEGKIDTIVETIIVKGESNGRH